MAENSTIEWCDHTFNPWIGCTKVGPGCDHCYAETLMAARYGRVRWGSGEARVRTSPANWAKPRAWDRKAAREGRRYRVFCASLADVFDNAVDPVWRRDLFDLIDETPNLDWLLLTKRIGNVRAMLWETMGRDACPRNVWLGATVVNQAEADRDVPKLLATPAQVRFLSIEPMLGPIDLTRLCQGTGERQGPWTGMKVRISIDCLRGATSIGWPPLDWIIVGGESGRGARPMHPDWARTLRDQCADAGVPFLFKQWGEWSPDLDYMAKEPLDYPLDSETGCFRVGKKAAGRLIDGVQHDGMPA